MFVCLCECVREMAGKSIASRGLSIWFRPSALDPQSSDYLFCFLNGKFAFFSDFRDSQANLSDIQKQISSISPMYKFLSTFYLSLFEIRTASF